MRQTSGEREGTAMSNQDIIEFNVSLSLPDFPNDSPASDKQRAALRAVLTNVFDDTDFTREQASLILDANTYLSGVIEHLRNTARQEFAQSGLFILKIQCIEKILLDETLWRRIRSWGQTEYSLGRSTSAPKLNPASQLFIDALAVVTDCAKKTNFKMLPKGSYDKEPDRRF
jgi:hypothetical protein